MRTDRSEKDFFWKELQEGRLRQGWGYESGLDLRRLREKRRAGNGLNDREQQAWRGNRRLLHDEQDGMREGDLVILPNLPVEGRWTIVEIVDDVYEFSIPPEYQDYGHIRHARIVSPSPIHPHAPAVSAKLRGTMRTQSRLWSANRYEEEIRSLILAIREGETVETPASEDDHLLTMHEVVREHLWTEISRRFRAADFEGPVKRVLEQVYDGDVEHRGGRNERGADLICNFTDDLGIPYSVAVQVKMWQGEGGLAEAFDQLRTAFQEYDHVSAGIVLTTLDTLDPRTAGLQEALEREVDRPIRVLRRDDVLDLFLTHMPDVVGALET